MWFKRTVHPHERHAPLQACLWDCCDWLVIRPAHGFVALITNLPEVVSPVVSALLRTIAAELSPADCLQVQCGLAQMSNGLRLLMPAIVVVAVVLAWCRPIAACLLGVSVWAVLL